MKISKGNIVPWVLIVLMLGFACHYYLADVTEVQFSNTMKLENRSCGEFGCTISFMGEFDERTKVVFISEDTLFENKVIYSKDKVLTVEGKIRYRKLRPHYWVREKTMFTKIDGQDLFLEEESTFVWKLLMKIM